jgi:hypothetical protein
MQQMILLKQVLKITFIATLHQTVICDSDSVMATTDHIDMLIFLINC